MADTAQGFAPPTGREAYRNFAVHATEGGIFMAALALISLGSVVPASVKELGGPDWLIALTPISMTLGVMLPGIFTAHLVERITRFKPYCMISGIFQRLPYLVAGLILVFGGDRAPMTAAVAAVLAPFVSGLSAGTTQAGWQQLLAKTVPVRMRAKLFAIRNFIAAVCGIAAGGIVKLVFSRHDTATGLGILYLAAFGVVTVSYILFSLVRERPHPSPPPHDHVSLWQNVRRIPHMLRTDRQLVTYILTRNLMNGSQLFLPFLAIQAKTVTERGTDFVGELVMAQMLGGIIGNLGWGFVGDHFGCKPLMIGVRVGVMVVAVWSALAGGAMEFRALFLVLGLVMSGHGVSTSAMTLEMLPRKDRATYLSVLALTGPPAMLLFALLCAGVTGVMKHAGLQAQTYPLLVGLAAVALSLSLIAATRLRPPPRG